MSSFKNSGMLLSEWIKVNQGLRQEKSSTNSRITNNFHTVSPQNHQISDTSSVISAQLVPSAYVRKMRIEGLNSNAQTITNQPTINKANNISPQIKTTNKTNGSQVQWYKLMKKQPVTKAKETEADTVCVLPVISKDSTNEPILENSTNYETQEATSTFHNQIQSDSSHDKPKECIQMKIENRSISDQTNESNATIVVIPGNVDTKEIKLTKVITDSEKCVVDETLTICDNDKITKEDQLKINDEVNERDIVKETNHLVLINISDIKPEVKPNSRENENIIIEKENVELVKKEEILNPANIIQSNIEVNDNLETVSVINDESKDKGNKIISNKLENSSHEAMNKLINDLDKIIENNLNVITSPNEDTDQLSTDEHKLIEKILTKEFQDNVDKFLTSKDYQNSFFNSCQHLAD